ncbi:hypothetical protein Glove_16g94 [Diversispora epigaea]|uniref:Uncharacterized protein n=1 Tax=Diversispora epigaea TaxID=1348612 RepID=A0A397JR70_9GLOM|nr:hypothetical protein Glove_16g94 [Diversispora epigaea]
MLISNFTRRAFQVVNRKEHKEYFQRHSKRVIQLSSHTTIFGWFEDQKLSSSSSTLPRGITIFKKTRLYSSTVYMDLVKLSTTTFPFVNLAEKAIYEFLAKNESAIPLEKMNVRNKLVHGIMINEKGRWSDHALQRVTILACEVVICLGGNYEDKKPDVVPGDKENVDPSQKRKLDNIENIVTPQKKRLDDANFRGNNRFHN